MKSNMGCKMTSLIFSFLFLILWADFAGACEEFERDYIDSMLLISKIRGGVKRADNYFFVIAKKCGFSIKNRNVYKDKIRQTVGWKAAGNPMKNSLDALIIKISKKHRLDPSLLKALVMTESLGKIDALSPKGARGLTQVMPITAELELGINPDLLWDPYINLDAGARYLAANLKNFGSLKKGLISYNAGPSVARKIKTSSDLRGLNSETKIYLQRFLKHYERYRASGFGG